MLATFSPFHSIVSLSMYSFIYPLDCITTLFDWIQNACTSSPCPSNANCSSLSETDFRCVCPPGYTGANCETGQRLTPQLHIYIYISFYNKTQARCAIRHSLQTNPPSPYMSVRPSLSLCLYLFVHAFLKFKQIKYPNNFTTSLCR